MRFSIETAIHSTIQPIIGSIISRQNSFQLSNGLFYHVGFHPDTALNVRHRSKFFTLPIACDDLKLVKNSR